MNNSVTTIAHPEIRNIFVYPSAKDTACAAAHFIASVVRNDPRAVITYPTGQTMIPVYRELAGIARKEGIKFSDTTAFQLDEYYPLGADADAYSCITFLYDHVVRPLDIQTVHTIDGTASDASFEADRFNAKLNSLPVTLTILGIGPWSESSGTGCHIAFNESGTPFDSQTHVAKLDSTTVYRDRKERGLHTPATAITQGIQNITDSGQILVVAYGKEKGTVLARALYGQISPAVPASALRLVGNKVTVVIDDEAGSVVKKKLIVD
jgi:glucosamine-6-phosphate deaminase